MNTRNKGEKEFRELMHRLGNKPKRLDSTEATPFSAFSADDGHPLLDQAAYEQWLTAQNDEEEQEEFCADFNEFAEDITVADNDDDNDHIPDYDLHKDDGLTTIVAQIIKDEEREDAVRAVVGHVNEDTYIPHMRARTETGHAVACIKKNVKPDHGRSIKKCNTRAVDHNIRTRQNRGLKQKLNAAEALAEHLYQLQRLERPQDEEEFLSPFEAQYAQEIREEELTQEWLAMNSWEARRDDNWDAGDYNNDEVDGPDFHLDPWDAYVDEQLTGAEEAVLFTPHTQDTEVQVHDKHDNEPLKISGRRIYAVQRTRKDSRGGKVVISRDQTDWRFARRKKAETLTARREDPRQRKTRSSEWKREQYRRERKAKYIAAPKPQARKVQKTEMEEVKPVFNFLIPEHNGFHHDFLGIHIVTDEDIIFARDADGTEYMMDR